MLKKIVIGIFAVIVVLTGALYTVWAKKAEEVKVAIEQKLQLAKSENSEVSYESVTTSGFPFSLNVSIVKPHLVGRIDKLLPQDKFQEIFQTTNAPEWSEDYALDGSIDFLVNAFSNKYQMVISGNWVGKSNISGKSFSIKSETNGDAVCTLEMSYSPASKGIDNLWNFAALESSKETFAQDFRSFDCSNLGGKTLNAENGELISNYEGGKISIRHKANGNMSDASFYVIASNFEYGKAGDEMLAYYSNALSPASKPFAMSSYGKQNLEIDFEYHGTNDFKNPDAKNMPFDFKLNKFYINSAIFDSNSNINLSSRLDNGNRDINFSYKTEITLTDLYRNLLADSFLNMVNEFLPDEKMKKKIADFKKDELEALVISIIPDFASFGKIALTMDAKYSGDDNFTKGETTLSNLEFSSKPYGINLSGNLKKSPEQLLPTGGININCNNCFKIIDDSVSYANRVKSSLSMLDETAAAFDIPMSAVQAIKSFLSQLSPEDKNNLKFAIVSNGSGEPTVNGKPMSEVASMFSQSVMPALQGGVGQGTEPALSQPQPAPLPESETPSLAPANR